MLQCFALDNEAVDSIDGENLSTGLISMSSQGEPCGFQDSLKTEHRHRTKLIHRKSSEGVEVLVRKHHCERQHKVPRYPRKYSITAGKYNMSGKLLVVCQCT